jgi:hypothetical protein
MSKRKNAVSAEGAKLLRKVAKHILEEPLRYNQDVIVERAGSNYFSDLTKPMFPKCGTIACIGGWIQVLTHKKQKKWDLPSTKKMAKLFGVPESAVDRLFSGIYATDYGEFWPQRFLDAYNNATTPRQRAKVANRVIEHFIKTGFAND